MKTSFALSLFLFGIGGHGPLAMAQSAGTFRATANMTTPRFLHTATLLADGRVLIAGGVTRKIESAGGALRTLASAELFDPRTGRFTATRNMTIPRYAHTATLLPDGKVLIAGGQTFSADGIIGPSFASAEVYDPFTGTFVRTGDMTEARAWHTATLLNNGRMLIAGGLYSCQVSCSPAGADIYDPDTGMFTATGNRISEWTDTATLLPNGKVLITRGAANGGPFLPSAALYDPSTGVFTAAAGYANPDYLGIIHSFRTAVLLTNGKVLIAAGSIGDGDGGSSGAELYDPATGAFVRTGDLITKREYHAAAPLGDGTVLFAGGNIIQRASSELYDPVTGTFSATGDMTTPRLSQQATLLRNGQVLITGGNDLSSAELYTPAVLIPAPVLLSFSGDGRGQGAILHGNTPQLASSDNPAAVGEALEIYLTGLGDRSVIPPQVVIGGRIAEVLWFGNTPGYAGLNQVNVRVPAGLAPGLAVPVRLTSVGRPSNEVTIGVR